MKYPILLPNIFDYPFTYESDLNLKFGDFVEVPFGEKKIFGIVWNELEKKNNKKFKIKIGFEFLLKEKNPINLFSKTFCKINFLKQTLSGVKIYYYFF